MLARVGKLRRALSDNGLDGFLVTNLTNCRYLSGFTGSTGWLLITADRAGIAVDSRYVEQARHECPEFELIPIRGYFPDWFFTLAVDLRAVRWGIESQAISLAAYHQTTEKIASDRLPLQLVSTSNMVESIRTIKEPDELDKMTQAARLADRAFEHALSVARPGITERQLAWEIERFMRENGSEPVSFEIIVASGPNSALPHARPSERVIEAGEPILLDFGARIAGYCSDFTRTICLGEPDPTLFRVYTIVLGAQLTALATMEAGMTGEQADQLARTVIAEGGYAETFGHGLGHGVGLDVHESPRLGTRSTDVLQQGVTFTIEPGVYLPGWGGVRIEDTVVMENQRVRPLTNARKTLKAHAQS
ncbi:MAG: aminopeptidase P family protein [Chloroflexota bacterium]